MVTKKNR